ncbi:restriction endonuclease subunit S [Streptomyces tendae]|uniref:restriction endonuclease subunit S n=1 Tax=Streptomyces tendae TaxID=1932 RepID=UPI0037195EB2
MTVVPDGWTLYTPHEIAGREKDALVIGPFGSNLKTSDYRDEGVPLIFVKDIRAENFSRPRAHVSIVKAAELKAHQVLPGDILVTKMGDPPGDVAVYDSDVPGIITADCIRLRPTSQFDRKYLVHSLRTPNVRHQIDAITTGAAQKKVNLDRFRTRLHIAAPPHVEQKRIAAVLDQVDALRAKRREAIALLENLNQSIFRSMFGNALENEAGYPRQRMLEWVDPERPITYGILKPGEDQQDGAPYVRVVDMKDGGIDTSAIRRTTREISNQYKRSLLRSGDILMSIRGHVGRLAVVPEELEGANITQDSARLAVPAESARYVMECMRTPEAQHWMERRTKGAAVKGINLGDIKTLEIPVPPLELQQRFSFRATKVDQLVSREYAHLAELDALFASIQHRAFRGELWADASAA